MAAMLRQHEETHSTLSVHVLEARGMRPRQGELRLAAEELIWLLTRSEAACAASLSTYRYCGSLSRVRVATLACPVRKSRSADEECPVPSASIKHLCLSRVSVAINSCLGRGCDYGHTAALSPL